MLARRAQRLRPSYLRAPAIIVAGVGLLTIAAVLLLPGLAAYAPGWPFLLVFTAICYGLIAASQATPRVAAPRVKDPDLDAVLRLRQGMEARLAALPRDNYLTRGVPGLLRQLDQELIPSLAQLAAKRQELGRHLAAYERAGQGGVRPDDATLARLRALHERQNQAVRDVVQQVVNMDASLLGLIQEGDEAHMARQVQDWAQEINLRWQGVAEVLGVEEQEAGSGR